MILLVVGMLALSFLPPDVEGATTKGEQLERVKRGHHGHGGGKVYYVFLIQVILFFKHKS